MQTTTTTNTGTATAETLMVHKEGEQGTLQVERLTGKIVTPLDDRPDWAEGLTTALVQERVTYYERALGAGSPTLKTLLTSPEAIEFSDLGWLGVDAEQNELSIEPDQTTRSEIIAKVLGIDTEEGTFPAGAIEAEAARDNQPRTAAEMAALEESVQQGFTGAETAGAQEDRQAARR